MRTIRRWLKQILFDFGCRLLDSRSQDYMLQWMHARMSMRWRSFGSDRCATPAGVHQPLSTREAVGLAMAIAAGYLVGLGSFIGYRLGRMLAIR